MQSWNEKMIEFDSALSKLLSCHNCKRKRKHVFAYLLESREIACSVFLYLKQK